MRLGAMGVEAETLDKVARMKLSTWQTFLLIRLVHNLKGSQVDILTFTCLTMYIHPIGGEGQIICGFSELCFSQVTKLFEELDKKGQNEGKKEEIQALLGREENTEMITVVDVVEAE